MTAVLTPLIIWLTTRLPLVNVISVNDAVQFVLGHPASCVVGLSGGVVLTVNETLPFFMLPAGMNRIPDGLTLSPGFCPGTTFPLPGVVHCVLPVPELNRST